MHIAHTRLARLAFLAHGLEGTHPALVAGASRLDALADPDLFLGQFLVEVGVEFFLGVEHGLLAFQVAAVVARPVGEPAALQVEDAGGQALQEHAVMGDEQQCATEAEQEFLQPGDGIDVQVVGGLVQQ